MIDVLDRHDLFLKVLSWFVFYSIVTAVPPVFLGIALMVVNTVFPQIMNSAFIAVFAIVIVLILIGVVSLLPFAQVALMRKMSVNPAVARQSIEDMEREEREKDNERKALGVLIGLGGIAFIVPINPISWMWWILPNMLGPYLGAYTMLAMFAFDLAFLSFLTSIYVLHFRKYVLR